MFIKFIFDFSVAIFALIEDKKRFIVYLKRLLFYFYSA
ncbi:hypothetical protein GCHA_2469 [Paraglaciecola chathamensis S18K6]|uniref:Uncharacterized protein n=1 Tax=Paraglaciecola chathamensis S18K6 TaxID=1127672 RepID=A0AAV3V030_9ALTE|nr:hypothetical protein GCHA_2469 [Paraglaciecola chathamensis S18K6]